MGRELKRVALDFDAPLDKVWEGYINPHFSKVEQCPDCELGYTPTAQRYMDQWYGKRPFDPLDYGCEREWQSTDPEFMQMAVRNLGPDADEFSLRKEAIRLFEYKRWQWGSNLIQADVDALWEGDRLRNWKTKPTAQELNSAYLFGLGHDAINQHICVEARCKRVGAEITCKTCNGSAEHWPNPRDKEAHDAWTKTEPPEGEGYQLWTTTNEGAPITPVYETLRELCEYASVNCTIFGYDKISADEWEERLSGSIVTHEIAPGYHML